MQIVNVGYYISDLKKKLDSEMEFIHFDSYYIGKCEDIVYKHNLKLFTIYLTRNDHHRTFFGTIEAIVDMDDAKNKYLLFISTHLLHSPYCINKLFDYPYFALFRLNGCIHIGINYINMSPNLDNGYFMEYLDKDGLKDKYIDYDEIERIHDGIYLFHFYKTNRNEEQQVFGDYKISSRKQWSWSTRQWS